jgi:hypothetical protein
MHPNRLGAFAVQGAATRGADHCDLVLRRRPARAFGAWLPASLALALRRRLASIRRLSKRPPSDPADLPPRMQSCDGHWEDPLLWLLVMH